MPASLTTTPAELLEQIILITTRQHHQGPPSALRSLRLTCRMSNNALSPQSNSYLYFMLFMDRFSPWRQFPGGHFAVHNIEHELRKRFRALQRIRRGDITDPEILESLSTIYIMILEDDGRNWDQLLWAQLPSFMTRFLRERLMVGSETNNGWPTENEVNVLAVSIFWLMSCTESIRDETDELRREFVELLSPYSFAGFRYPCFTGIEYNFCPSENSRKTVTTSAHGAYPPNRPVSITINYFGRLIPFNLPPLAPYAILVHFSRLETRPLMIPPHLPETRAVAVANGISGPTKEDIVYFNTRCKTHFPGTMYGNNFDTLLKSRRHDPDWTRSIRDPLYRSPSSLPGQYIPGTISGRWQGSFIAPYYNVYKDMLSSPTAPSPFPTFGRFPLYVTFRELYCYSPSIPLPLEENEGAFENAFLPIGCRWHETEAGIEFTGENMSFKAYYSLPRQEHLDIGFVGRTACESRPSAHGVFDVIITGVTEDRYAAAWGGYRYMGRIRPSDGLIVLLREPLNPQMVELGRALFRGYIVSSRNFVGRWKFISSAVHPAEWESIFSLCKDVSRE
ncbi:hypothetical protein DEU56DRAFT_467515 [Suillus clintonianus]|uniref:uncharacterized protein n=1 Tax=Suillus clintonianus TaxID=1904413 RepID=UPI001B8839EC|nr:uncharacterized protein DEU56DRAFT_467515 [Suillus clintonianus]KAG2130357.1 hypothetical protein DEU56DRAFT_467515 [Suillus clintonianus]